VGSRRGLLRCAAVCGCVMEEVGFPLALLFMWLGLARQATCRYALHMGHLSLSKQNNYLPCFCK
jgi:hypothetical protein